MADQAPVSGVKSIAQLTTELSQARQELARMEAGAGIAEKLATDCRSKLENAVDGDKAALEAEAQAASSQAARARLAVETASQELAGLEARLTQARQQRADATAEYRHRHPIQAALLDAWQDAESKSRQFLLLLLVLMAGAIGGYSADRLDLVSKERRYADKASAGLAGALAAGVAIYVLARSDRRQVLHCIFFALICGLTSRPILEAAMRNALSSSGAEVPAAEALKASEEVDAGGEKLKEATNEAETKAAVEAIEQGIASASQAQQAAKAEEQPRVARQAEQIKADGVATILTYLHKAPEAVAQSLKEMAERLPEGAESPTYVQIHRGLAAISQHDDADSLAVTASNKALSMLPPPRAAWLGSIEMNSLGDSSEDLAVQNRLEDALKAKLFIRQRERLFVMDEKVDFNQTSVLYFRTADRTEAEYLASILRELGVVAEGRKVDVRFARISKPADRNFDLRIGRNALSAFLATPSPQK